MVVETKVNIATAWKVVSQPEVNVGGDWKDCISIQSNVGGSWETVWEAVGGGFVDMGLGENVDHTNPGTLIQAKFSFETDGTVHDYGPTILVDNGKMSAGEWWSEEPEVGIGSSYDVREDLHYGDTWFYQGASLDDWVQMNLNRGWGLRRLGMNEGESYGWGTFEISLTGNETYIDRQNYSVTINNVS